MPAPPTTSASPLRPRAVPWTVCARLGSRFGLALVLAALAGCNPINNPLWPSIEPVTRQPDGSLAPVNPERSAGASQPILPGNFWELAGGLGLILGCGGLGVFLWKGSRVQRRVDALQTSAESLARRREIGTADLLQLSRKVNDLNQQVSTLKAELSTRPAPAALAAPAAVAVPAPASPPPLSPSPPSPPPRPAQAQVPAGQADSAAQQARPVSFSIPAPEPGRPQAPQPSQKPVLVPALELLRQAAEEPVAAPPSLPTPTPATRPPSRPQAPPAQAPAPAPEAAAPLAGGDGPVTLGDLVDALNGRGTRQIEGITFAELDTVAFPGAEEIGRPDAPRLGLVSNGGRFLMVLLDDDAWLFPAVTTLEAFSQDPSAPGIYRFEPAGVDHAELKRPALLREVGGLWEVTEPGTILLPVA